MIKRYPGTVPTRSRIVVSGGLVYTVATAKKKVPSLYEQAKDALAAIEANLKEAGSSKAKILTATVYITNMANKPEMNRAWDEWVDKANPPQRACIGAVLEGEDLIEVLVTAAM